MPYPIPNAAIVEVSIKYTLAGQTCLNIGHFRYASDVDTHDGPTVLNGFAAIFDADLVGATQLLSNCTTTEVSIDQLVMQLIYPTRWARRVYDTNQSAGILEPPTCPPNWVTRATKRSEIAGRHGHGGLTISGMPTEAIAENRIAAEQVILANTYVGAWCVGYALDSDLGSFDPIIYNRKFPATSPSVSEYDTEAEPRSLRRRQLRVGI